MASTALQRQVIRTSGSFCCTPADGAIRFTAAEAADTLGVHRNVARSRLDRLAEAGFLAVAGARPSGRSGPGAGRPAKVYRVAPEFEGIEFPDRRLADLIGLLVEKLPVRRRPTALRDRMPSTRSFSARSQPRLDRVGS